MSQMPTGPLKGPYQKPWRSCADLIAMWQQRGLAVQDATAAAQFLEHVNYYRFSAYCPPFEHSRDQFIIGTSFEDLRAAYEFDWVLRDLIAEGLELFEVDLRTVIANKFGLAHGPFGHINHTNFHRSFSHYKWLQRLQRQATDSDEQFVVHFANTYSNFPNLPIWMLTEIISFGTLSMMFKHMLRPDQRSISMRYGVQPVYLESWIHHLVYIRNLCAHHARLWDRVWAIKPQLPTSNVWTRPSPVSNDRLFVTLLILNHLIKSAPCIDAVRQVWKNRVQTHLSTLPTCPNASPRMGLATTWHQHPLWS